jgi:hypothetical protein
MAFFLQNRINSRTQQCRSTEESVLALVQPQKLPSFHRHIRWILAFGLSFTTLPFGIYPTFDGWVARHACVLQYKFFQQPFALQCCIFFPSGTSLSLSTLHEPACQHMTKQQRSTCLEEIWHAWIAVERAWVATGIAAQKACACTTKLCDRKLTILSSWLVTGSSH